MPSDAIDALNSADTYELLSLDPTRADTRPTDEFHSWRVLGRVMITDKETRTRLNQALRAGAQAKVDSEACFEPRHGIRVTHAGHTTDFVICFGCGHAYVYSDEKQIPPFRVSFTPDAVFDEVLKSHSIPMASR